MRVRQRAPRPASVNVKKRAGRYIVDVSFPAPEGRKRHRQMFERKAEADAHADAIRGRLRDGLPPFETEAERAPVVTVADVLAFYEERHVAAVASARARERLKTHREAIGRCVLAGLGAEAVTLEDLRLFASDRKVSAGTVAKDFRHLKAAMLFARAHGRITRHVFETLDRDTRRNLMPSWRPEDTAGRVLSNEEFEAILPKLSPAARPIVRFLRATGLRKMEACALDWREHWRDLPYPSFCPITQKGSKARLIPFEAVEAIVGPRRPGGLVFHELGATAEEIYGRVTAAWRHAVKAAKVPHCRLHDLRHTFGSELRRSMSKEDVASTMGISGTIAGTYLDHESADLTRRAFSKLGTNVAESGVGAAPETGRK